MLDDRAPVAGTDAAEAAWVDVHDVADLRLVDGLAEFLHEHGYLEMIVTRLAATYPATGDRAFRGTPSGPPRSPRSTPGTDHRLPRLLEGGVVVGVAQLDHEPQRLAHGERCVCGDPLGEHEGRVERGTRLAQLVDHAELVGPLGRDRDRR